MSKVKTLVTLILLVLYLSQAFASIPLGTARKTASGTVSMVGCLQANDYYVVNFAAYPVEATKAKKLPVPECVNLPDAGNTLITLDLLDRDVRRKQVAVKELAKNGQLVAETPFSVSKQGVVSTQVNFDKAGKYEIILFVNDSDLNIDKTLSALHIPLTVAMPGEEPAARNTMAGFFIVLFLIISGLAVLVPRFLRTDNVQQQTANKSE
jgi:hypothetical protein